jgi:hypothetical protein
MLISFLDLDNTPSPGTDEDSDDAYDLTSPVASFLQRSRKQVERYFRRLTQPEPPENGKKTRDFSSFNDV